VQHQLRQSYNTDDLVARSTALGLVTTDEFKEALASKDWFAFANPFEDVCAAVIYSLYFVVMLCALNLTLCVGLFVA
jgi:hypothetical protein